MRFETFQDGLKGDLLPDEVQRPLDVELNNVKMWPALNVQVSPEIRCCWPQRTPTRSCTTSPMSSRKTFYVLEGYFIQYINNDLETGGAGQEGEAREARVWESKEEKVSFKLSLSSCFTASYRSWSVLSSTVLKAGAATSTKRKYNSPNSRLQGGDLLRRRSWRGRWGRGCKQE